MTDKKNGGYGKPGKAQPKKDTSLEPRARVDRINRKVYNALAVIDGCSSFPVNESIPVEESGATPLDIGGGRQVKSSAARQVLIIVREDSQGREASIEMPLPAFGLTVNELDDNSYVYISIRQRDLQGDSPQTTMFTERREFTPQPNVMKLAVFFHSDLRKAVEKGEDTTGSFAFTKIRLLREMGYTSRDKWVYGKLPEYLDLLQAIRVRIKNRDGEVKAIQVIHGYKYGKRDTDPVEIYFDAMAIEMLCEEKARVEEAGKLFYVNQPDVLRERLPRSFPESLKRLLKYLYALGIGGTEELVLTKLSGAKWFHELELKDSPRGRAKNDFCRCLDLAVRYEAVTSINPPLAELKSLSTGKLKDTTVELQFIRDCGKGSAAVREMLARDGQIFPE